MTGEYTSTVRTPTGIPSDPALASYGVKQAEQLGDFLLTLDPPVDLVYSSPFYRCIQTLQPFVEKVSAAAKNEGAGRRNGESGGKDVKVRLEPGVGEFYGLARFDHPSPATVDVLRPLFPSVALSAPSPAPIIVPSTKGESIPQLHDRIAYALHHLIRRADADRQGPRSLLICTHAAAIIAIGRALTGRMPEEEGEEDFRCFTCGFSKFARKAGGSQDLEVAAWDPEKAEEVPEVGWRDGKGVGGGWTCEANSDCSFLDGGEERGW